MVAAFIIGFRETFEAALIVGILLIYLKKIGQAERYGYVYRGCFVGLVASLLFGLIPNLLNTVFDTVNKHVFNATILYVAVVVMTSMLLWMHHSASNLKKDLESKTSLAINSGKLYGLVLLAFLGVFREGVETVLFMWGIIASAQTVSAASTAILSCAAGGALAILFSWGFFNGFLGSFSLKKFFRVTTVLLLLITAGMFAKATGKLIKADVLSPIIAQVWDSSWILSEKGNITGKIVSGMTGYVSKPSLLELLAYTGYISVMLVVFFREKLSFSLLYLSKKPVDKLAEANQLKS